ncbi:unnamed protein product [Taenia asiatica]|uniref:Uncharacterized protein n=1 Tax=Taenia asiatica TaxID=60517 RepID=A0A3P6QFM3_TAEAS|nr:unnamed protein product [Taenia asiatica]
MTFLPLPQLLSSLGGVLPPQPLPSRYAVSGFGKQLQGFVYPMQHITEFMRIRNVLMNLRQ